MREKRKMETTKLRKRKKKRLQTTKKWKGTSKRIMKQIQRYFDRRQLRKLTTKLCIDFTRWLCWTLFSCTSNVREFIAIEKKKLKSLQQNGQQNEMKADYAMRCAEDHKKSNENRIKKISTKSEMNLDASQTHWNGPSINKNERRQYRFHVNELSFWPKSKEPSFMLSPNHVNDYARWFSLWLRPSSVIKYVICYGKCVFITLA